MSGNSSIWTSASFLTPVTSVFGRTGSVIGQVGDYTTDFVTE